MTLGLLAAIAACHSQKTDSAPPPPPPSAGSDGTLTAAQCKDLGGETVAEASCPMKLMCVTTDKQAKHSSCVMKPDATPPTAP
jgi:hypothetical protein